MRRLAITNLCAIALLSGCGGGGVGTATPTIITLPCPGKNVHTDGHPVHKIKQTIRFDFGGKCNFTPSFSWVGYNGKDPPGFAPHQPITYPTATILYDYDGSDIPEPGYTFTYINDDPRDGNGSGVIKIYR